MMRRVGGGMCAAALGVTSGIAPAFRPRSPQTLGIALDLEKFAVPID
jgi:hypothetical protein